MRIQYHGVAHSARLVCRSNHSFSRWQVSTIKKKTKNKGNYQFTKKGNFKRTSQLPAHKKEIVRSVLWSNWPFPRPGCLSPHQGPPGTPEVPLFLAQGPGSDTAPRRKLRFIDTDTLSTAKWSSVGLMSRSGRARQIPPQQHALPQQQTGVAPRGVTSTLDWPYIGWFYFPTMLFLSLFLWEGGSLDFALSLLIIFSTSSSLWTWKFIKRGRGKKKKEWEEKEQSADYHALYHTNSAN